MSFSNLVKQFLERRGAVVANAGMIALVRESRGWNQRTLAEKAGLSQGQLSKIENGIVDLPDTKLDDLAGALGCPPVLLTSSLTPEGLGVTCLHHRRFSSKVSATAARRVDALTHLSRLSIAGLLPVSTNQSTAHHGARSTRDGAWLRELGATTAEDSAQAVRRAWGIVRGPIDNLIDQIENSGVVVAIRSLETNSQSGVSTWPSGAFSSFPLLVLNTGLPGDRLRFTAAHELGHLALHTLPDPANEQDADRFAAELLMPTVDARRELDGLLTSDFPRLLQLKATWKVSLGMLIRRARDVEHISDRQFREFRIRLSRMGWNTNEPGEVPIERPRRVREHIAAALAAGSTIDDLARAALTTPETFTAHYMPTVADTGTSNSRPLGDVQ